MNQSFRRELKNSELRDIEEAFKEIKEKEDINLEKERKYSTYNYIDAELDEIDRDLDMDLNMAQRHH